MFTVVNNKAFLFFIAILDHVLDMHMDILKGEQIICSAINIIKFYIFYKTLFKAKISLDN